MRKGRTAVCSPTTLLWWSPFRELRVSPALVRFSSNIYLSPVGFKSMLSRVAGEYGHTVCARIPPLAS